MKQNFVTDYLGGVIASWPLGRRYYPVNASSNVKIASISIDVARWIVAALKPLAMTPADSVRILSLSAIAFLFLAAPATAQNSGMKLDSTQPIEIVSDTLEVFQEKQQAIFSGNVIATQGNINMRSAIMTVFYRNTANEDAPTTPETTGVAGEGIYRIEADGDVFFASPLETAQGDSAVYDVDASTVTILGNVLLTREGNVLKGTQMTYNLSTGRSILNGGGAVAAGGSGRVRGLFVPKNKPQKAVP